MFFVQSYSKSVQIFFQKIIKNMGEQNGTKWKDEGLDCLVLDEFLIPNPKNIENVPSNNGDVNVPKTGENKIDSSDTSQASTVRYSGVDTDLL